MLQTEPTEAILEKVDTCPICNSNKFHLIHRDLSDRLLLEHERKWNLFKCDRCQHAWLNPRYTKEAIYLAYEGYSDNVWPGNEAFSKSILKQRIKDAYYMREYGYETNTNLRDKLLSKVILFLAPGLASKFDRQIRYLSAQKKGSLLDIGSGTGWFLENMQRLGWNVRGLDIDETSAEKVRKRGIPVDLGFLEDQPYLDESFDVITMAHVIEHLHDPMNALAICLRILKPGGSFVILTPNIESLGHDIFQASWQPLEAPRHLNIFSVGSMQFALEKTGFQIERLDTLNDIASSVWIKSQAIQKTGGYSAREKGNLLSRVAAQVFCKREKRAIETQTNKGEEILVICQKPVTN